VAFEERNPTYNYPEKEECQALLAVGEVKRSFYWNGAAAQGTAFNQTCHLSRKAQKNRTM
jgi:hypothetical protein